MLFGEQLRVCLQCMLCPALKSVAFSLCGQSLMTFHLFYALVILCSSLRIILSLFAVDTICLFYNV